jgi:RNA polymerase sigma-70 factor, ECF subfamily
VREDELAVRTPGRDVIAGSSSAADSPPHRSPPAPADNRPFGSGWDHEADQWLVDQVTSGSSAAARAQAFEVLLRRHQDRIYRLALRMLGDPSDAEDVAQDVAVQLWRVLATFTGASAFSTWLYRIVVNRCLNHQRARASPARNTAPLLEADHPTSAGPEQRVLDAARLDAATSALGALPAEQRAALVLCQIEGLTYREAAAIINTSEAALRSRLERARRNLLVATREWT